MQPADEALYPASSPSINCEPDMSRQFDPAAPDFDLFDSGLPLEATTSPGVFNDFTTSNAQYPMSFGSPEASNYKNPQLEPASFIDSSIRDPSLSAPSTASPHGSFEDSSSDSSGSNKRKSSSSQSSRSAVASGDITMSDDGPMGEYNMDNTMRENDAPSFGNYDGTINPMMMDSNLEFSDKTMENDFDFDSAASSPSPFPFTSMESPKMPRIKHEQMEKRNNGLSKTKSAHNKANSVSSNSCALDCTLTIVATLCYAVHERAYDHFTGGFSPFRHDDEPRILASDFLQLTISWLRRGVHKWDNAES